MHLWPTMRLRDSFKSSYLKKLEWNLHRMNAEKKQQAGNSSNDSNDKTQNLLVVDKEEGKSLFLKAVSISRELLLIVSCCYCCFCCGVCVEDEES